jgi:hypothetical protein
MDEVLLARRQGRAAYPRKLRGDNPYRDFIQLSGEAYLNGMKCYDAWDKAWFDRSKKPYPSHAND